MTMLIPDFRPEQIARVLVVEDMPALRRHTAETIAEISDQIKVTTAVDGLDAIAKIEANPDGFHLIVSDIIMPRLDGEGLLAELNRRKYQAAVIMLTALGQDDTIVRCLRLGACDYLVKPVTMDDLVQSATNALQHMPLLTTHLDVEFDPHGWFEVSGETDGSVLFKYRKFIGLLEKFSMPEPAASEVRLALEELGRNAIEWGNRNDKSKRVTFGCRILPGKVIVYIEDEGSGFDPVAVPDPSQDPLGHIDQRRSSGKRMGGYGIHLIRHLMDKVVYNARGNRVVAIKYLTRERAEASGYYRSVNDLPS
jgi:anti-sigma regulatory factor (Ser/Thr protein kinase)/CheY-like chemotaxis protein